MGKTTRRNSYTDKRSLRAHVDREVAYWKRRPYDVITVRLTEDEYDETMTAATERYEERVRHFAKSRVMSLEDARNHTTKSPWGGADYYTIRRPYVWGYKRVCVPVEIDERIEDAIEEYKSYNRDGKYNETGRNTAFKRLSKNAVRRENKKMTHAILRGDDYNMPYPGDHLGKKYIWSVW